MDIEKAYGVRELVNDISYWSSIINTWTNADAIAPTITFLEVQPERASIDDRKIVNQVKAIVLEYLGRRKQELMDKIKEL